MGWWRMAAPVVEKGRYRGLVELGNGWSHWLGGLIGGGGQSGCLVALAVRSPLLFVLDSV